MYRQELTAEEFRSVLAHLATGVVVVTATTPDGPVGMAVNSFTSLSLDPPLVLFCAASTSTTWPAIQRAGHFSVNILSAEQEHAARQFSRPGDRFEGVAWSPNDIGGPRLHGAHARLDCDIENEYPGGDHTIVVGRVRDVTTEISTYPLVFHRGEFHHLGGAGERSA